MYRPMISPKLNGQLSVCFSHPEMVLFLDIETTGLSHYYDEITIVGWSLNGRANTYIKGESIEALANAARQARAIVTFNGIRFDQKFLKQEFPEVVLPGVHVDLMYLCRRVGLTGGQKSIEEQLGLEFRQDLEGVDGFAAVLLWHQYLRGDVGLWAAASSASLMAVPAMGAILDEALSRLSFDPDLFAKEVSFRDWSAPARWNEPPEVLKPPHPLLTRAPTFGDLFSDTSASIARVVGIDLTGSEARPSGWCLLDGNHARTRTISTDDELLAATLGCKPDLVSIDSPLCLPSGRVSVFDDDPGRAEFGIMRQCERELKRRGVNVYPSLLPSMQKLTARGIRLADNLRSKGIPVIESYPGATQDIMRIPRKGAGVEWLNLGLGEFGIDGNFRHEVVTHDELDAITSALVGTFHLAGLSEELGTKDEPPLIIPNLTPTQKPAVVGVSGPIAAGKTTVAETLQDRGYTYTRFSLVIDEILDDRKLTKTRKNRQLIGNEMHETGRQRELAERTLQRVSGASLIIVDGLRFPEDHAFLVEKFGLRFRHLFVDAEASDRKKRYIARLEKGVTLGTREFEEASKSDVEEKVAELQELAHATFFNNVSKLDIGNQIENLVEQLYGEQ